ncbi:MAG: NAD(P)/FAD-dependent oxidoreductase [Marinobacter sp.]|nr:NAD(P)/FAD-dependent oxidoreductase [Marinobacter sp.]
MSQRTGNMGRNVSERSDPPPVTVIGAGPAGLACAIVLARNGQRVIVHERRSRVGARFHGDFQGLESWSDGIDVLDELTGAGIQPSFEHHAISQVSAFDGWGGRHEVRSDKPLYYLVKRGPGTDTLDHALLEQAQASGVEIRLSSSIKNASGPAVVATGPLLANVMAVGYLFETTMPDGQWACFSDSLAPGGYAYLLVQNGQGTVATCLFREFTHSDTFLARTIAFFNEHVGLDMRAARPFGGVGNYGPPCRGEHEGQLLVGEHAGFQDALAGFGMRYALRSGILAARSLLEGNDYDSLWRRSLLPDIRQSIGNRLLYAKTGDWGRRAMFRRMATGDARPMLAKLYRPSLLGRILYPLARRHGQIPQHDSDCCDNACTCLRCLCERHINSETTASRLKPIH